MRARGRKGWTLTQAIVLKVGNGGERTCDDAEVFVRRKWRGVERIRQEAEWNSVEHEVEFSEVGR